MPESIVIDESSVIEYQSAGHLTLRSALPRAKVQGVRATVEGLVREATSAALPLEQRDTYGKAFLQVQDLNRRDARAREFVWDESLARVAASFKRAQAAVKRPGMRQGSS